MKAKSALLILLLLSTRLAAQQTHENPSVIDELSYGVVWDIPATKNVTVKADVLYMGDANSGLHIDIYSPPGLKPNEKQPAIIFLNGIGDNPGGRKLKSWGSYTSWPRLMAANGYIGISMECDGKKVQESIAGVFNFIASKGSQYHINHDKLGIYAASANVNQSVAYLMSGKAYPGIKAAVLYYGFNPTGPFRKDLPVLFVIAEGDLQRSNYSGLLNEVLKNNAPWTIKMGTGMPHAFDIYADNDDARKIIKETISFWQNNLEPAPASPSLHSEERDVIGSMQMYKSKALSLLKSLNSRYPNDAHVAELYVNTLRESRQFEEAKTVYEKLLNSQPKNTRVLISLAELNFAQNKPDEGERYVSIAEGTGGMSHNLYARLGRSLIALNENKEAAKYYEKAVAIEPQGGDFYDLGCAYAKEGEKDKAFAALNNAVKYGSNSKQQYESDTDLNSLKSDERFKELLGKTK